jgi:hypothetical protein
VATVASQQDADATNASLAEASNEHSRYGQGMEPWVGNDVQAG